MNKSELEVLAPAGDMERFKAALNYGADAIYLAGRAFGMRAGPANFSHEELCEAVKLAHEKNVKIYMTVNTLPREYQIKTLPEFLIKAQEAGVDALIIADLGVLAMCKKYIPDMELHMSTQTGIVNSETCNFLWKQGVKRAVLARELSLDEISEIRKNIPDEMDLEVFVHGAMCMSFSGRCLISEYLTGRDANQGMCAQPCRWKYALVEEKRPNSFFPIEETDEGSYFFNAEDLCMIRYIKELAEAGVKSLKIEGRAKSAYYTAITTNAYHIATECYKNNINTPDWVYDEVYKCSHRKYCTGFFFKNNPPKQNYETSGYERDWEEVAVIEKCTGGKVYAEQRNRFFPNDELEVLSPGKEPVTIKPEKLYDEKGEEIQSANHACMKVIFECDKVFPKDSIVRKKL